MKAQVIESFSGEPGYKWTVKLVQDHQSFKLGYRGTKRDCEWYARMFRIALKRHDADSK